MSWWEDLLIAAGSIADTETKGIDKRKQAVDKSLKKATKGSLFQAPDKNLKREVKKLNADYDRAFRKGSVKGMNKSVTELEKINKAQKRGTAKK